MVLLILGIVGKIVMFPFLLVISFFSFCIVNHSTSGPIYPLEMEKGTDKPTAVHKSRAILRIQHGILVVANSEEVHLIGQPPFSESFLYFIPDIRFL